MPDQFDTIVLDDDFGEEVTTTNTLERIGAIIFATIFMIPSWIFCGIADPIEEVMKKFKEAVDEGRMSLIEN